MQILTKLILEDMKPALGVTEPGAIAFAAAKARSYTGGELLSVLAEMNSGLYKNAFTCGIPNSKEVGNVFAAALGAVAGKHEKGLEALADVTPADNEAARRLVEAGKVKVKLSGISSEIFLEVTVRTATDTATVTIRHSHTELVKIVVNGAVLLDCDRARTQEPAAEAAVIHRYSLAELAAYAERVELSELLFLREAYRVNLELFEEGLRNPRTTFARQLREMNGGEIFSSNEQSTAALLCGGAIEARVLGLDKPAMSITGSGAHGIICTLPLYAAYRVRGYSEEKLLRATALSYLVTMYIKEYSGRLSAFCGCAIAAGSGMACALSMLRGGDAADRKHILNNMASSITGMICDGGNQGCTMKGILAVDAAWRSVELAMRHSYIEDIHGINGRTPEETMRRMGLIASPGMLGTEKTIVEILEDKLRTD